MFYVRRHFGTFIFSVTSHINPLVLFGHFWLKL